MSGPDETPKAGSEETHGAQAPQGPVPPPAGARPAPGGTTPQSPRTGGSTPPFPPGPPGASVAVCVEVRNTGSRPGREVVQVYASRPDSAVERPAKWLAGFAAVDADPGETVTVGILLPERAFQHWADGGWTLEAGTFALAAGSSSASLPLTAAVTLKLTDDEVAALDMASAPA